MKKILLIFLFCIFSNTAQALDLSRIHAHLLRADYLSAINEAERILAEQKGQEQGIDELYYLLAIAYLKNGNLLRAADIFEIIINEFKNSRFRDEAYLGLGDISLLESDYADAEKRYREFLMDNSSSRLAALANFKLAQALLKQGKWEDAKECLKYIEENYPLSLEAKLIKKLSGLEMFFTVQVGSFSNQNNAQILWQKLSQQGYPAYLQEVESEGKTIYRVRVGKLETRQEAEKLEKELSSLGYPVKIFP